MKLDTEHPQFSGASVVVIVPIGPSAAANVPVKATDHGTAETPPPIPQWVCVLCGIPSKEAIRDGSVFHSLPYLCVRVCLLFPPCGPCGSCRCYGS